MVSPRNMNCSCYVRRSTVVLCSNVAVVQLLWVGGWHNTETCSGHLYSKSCCF
jgi:hypothetical protein